MWGKCSDHKETGQHQQVELVRKVEEFTVSEDLKY